MIVNLYFIRHIPTGNFLRRGRNRSRGSTHYEPEPFNECTRIFYSYKSANGALDAWCRGKYMPTYDDQGSYWETITPVITRIKSDMEIIMRSIDI